MATWTLLYVNPGHIHFRQLLSQHSTCMTTNVVAQQYSPLGSHSMAGGASLFNNYNESNPTKSQLSKIWMSFERLLITAGYFKATVLSIQPICSISCSPSNWTFYKSHVLRLYFNRLIMCQPERFGNGKLTGCWFFLFIIRAQSRAKWSNFYCHGCVDPSQIWYPKPRNLAKTVQLSALKQIGQHLQQASQLALHRCDGGMFISQSFRQPYHSSIGFPRPMIG